VALLALLPLLFTLLNQLYETTKSHSEVQKSVLGRYFQYQVSERKRELATAAPASVPVASVPVASVPVASVPVAWWIRFCLRAPPSFSS